jgi:cytolysin-activating lysine-acyltransferase
MNPPKYRRIRPAQLLGDVAWVLMQSAAHSHLKIHDLTWAIMPALVHKQIHVFRSKGRPVGFALWAECDEDAEAKLLYHFSSPRDHLTVDDWKSGSKVWMIELIAPFANADNRQRDIMLLELMLGPLQGRNVNFTYKDTHSGEQKISMISAYTGDDIEQYRRYFQGLITPS